MSNIDYISMAIDYAIKQDEAGDEFRDCHEICDRCETYFDSGIHAKCPACGCVDFHNIYEEEEE